MLSHESSDIFIFETYVKSYGASHCIRSGDILTEYTELNYQYQAKYNPRTSHTQKEYDLYESIRVKTPEANEYDPRTDGANEQATAPPRSVTSASSASSQGGSQWPDYDSKGYPIDPWTAPKPEIQK